MHLASNHARDPPGMVSLAHIRQVLSGREIRGLLGVTTNWFRILEKQNLANHGRYCMVECCHLLSSDYNLSEMVCW
ncbi:unnamed protein product [Nezara viridula]|uniref:Uncharacterized protein n=1 Tax=Nezara viridula TaxID=85310 RepID=A0A9P0ECG8_NEZVI|nr:unnamed protein product [Nezara viridula]